jgi:hypothetical protein
MGGDSCGRSIILGAVLAAVHGIGGRAGIPLDWLLRGRRNLEASEILAHGQPSLYFTPRPGAPKRSDGGLVLVVVLVLV